MSSFVIFAERYEAMCLFYAMLFDVELGATDTPIHITDGSNHVFIHQIPSDYLSDVEKPPTIQAEASIKPIFDVDSSRIDSIEEDRILKTFVYENRTHIDISDPDGNVICLRTQV